MEKSAMADRFASIENMRGELGLIVDGMSTSWSDGYVQAHIEILRLSKSEFLEALDYLAEDETERKQNHKLIERFSF